MINVPGVPMLGPVGSSTPATLVDWLGSIGKNSFWGRYLPGQGMAPNSDGSGGTVSTGGAVGCWAAYQSSNWTAKFIQATSAARPQYSTSASTYGPVIQGNGTSWGLYCDSATAFDRDCTLLLSAQFDNSSGYAWIHASDQWSLYTNVGAPPAIYYNGTELGDGLDWSMRSQRPSGGGSWVRRRKYAISSGASTARYGGVFRLLSGNGAYFSNVKILEFCVVPKLTEPECAAALTYLAG